MNNIVSLHLFWRIVIETLHFSWWINTKTSHFSWRMLVGKTLWRPIRSSSSYVWRFYACGVIQTLQMITLHSAEWRNFQQVSKLAFFPPSIWSMKTLPLRQSPQQSISGQENMQQRQDVGRLWVGCGTVMPPFCLRYDNDWRLGKSLFYWQKANLWTKRNGEIAMIWLKTGWKMTLKRKNDWEMSWWWLKWTKRRGIRKLRWKRDSIIGLDGKRQMASLHTRRNVGQLML